MVTLFNNSISDLKSNTLTSKTVILKLIKDTLEGLRTCCTVYEELVKKNVQISHYKLNMNPNWIDVVEKNDYTTPETEWKKLRLTESKKFLDQIKSGVELEDKDILSLAQCFEEIVGSYTSKAKSSHKKIHNVSGSIEQIFEMFMNFPEDFLAIKEEIGAIDDSDKFYKNLYANYNTKIKFIIKNYLIQFDIIQKALKKARVSHLDVLTEENSAQSNSAHTKINFLFEEIEDLKTQMTEEIVNIKNV